MAMIMQPLETLVHSRMFFDRKHSKTVPVFIFSILFMLLAFFVWAANIMYILVSMRMNIFSAVIATAFNVFFILILILVNRLQHHTGNVYHNVHIRLSGE